MRRADSAPAFSADFVSIMVSSVEFEPVPAMTGTLLLAISMASSITLLCSSYERVADSPVVPHGTRPDVPFDIWNSMSLLNAASSTRPSLNGVTRAVIEPVNIIPPNRLLKKSICCVVFIARRCDVHEEYDSLIKRRELPCIWSFLSSLTQIEVISATYFYGSATNSPEKTKRFKLFRPARNQALQVWPCRICSRAHGACPCRALLPRRRRRSW